MVFDLTGVSRQWQGRRAVTNFENIHISRRWFSCSPPCTSFSHHESFASKYGSRWSFIRLVNGGEGWASSASRMCPVLLIWVCVVIDATHGLIDETSRGRRPSNVLVMVQTGGCIHLWVCFFGFPVEYHVTCAVCVCIVSGRLRRDSGDRRALAQQLCSSSAFRSPASALAFRVWFQITPDLCYVFDRRGVSLLKHTARCLRRQPIYGAVCWHAIFRVAVFPLPPRRRISSSLGAACCFPS